MIETIDIATQLHEKWMLVWSALGIGLVLLPIAWMQGLFTAFSASQLPAIQGKDVLKGFGLFLFIELFFIPFLLGILFFILAGQVEDEAFLNPTMRGWINFFIILGGFIGVIIAYLQLTPIQREQIWRQTSTPWYQHFKIAMIAWLVAYPLVIAFSQLISIAVWQLFHHPFIEQIAVQNLRQASVNPWLFSVMAFAVVVLVPITEEYLFRGLLQSWLKRKLPHYFVAIFLSSLLFTAFHYSNTQGLANIELLSSLFILSCVIGYIYERQRSLLAPIALHGFFNFMSFLMIAASKE